MKFIVGELISTYWLDIWSNHHIALSLQFTYVSVVRPDVFKFNNLLLLQINVVSNVLAETSKVSFVPPIEPPKPRLELQFKYRRDILDDTFKPASWFVLQSKESIAVKAAIPVKSVMPNAATWIAPVYALASETCIAVSIFVLILALLTNAALKMESGMYTFWACAFKRLASIAIAINSTVFIFMIFVFSILINLIFPSLFGKFLLLFILLLL